MASETLREVYFNRRMAALLGLGFASGLPLMLTGSTLQAWAQDAHWQLETITLFSLITLPYSLKVIWAPLMDRYRLPLLGRRRGWLLLAQILLVGAILLMAASGPAVGAVPSVAADPRIYLFVMAALLVAFLSASQDIVADAYRTDILCEEERGAGAAVFTMGYRVGLILGGAGALMFADLGWRAVYAGLACAMVVGLLATLLAPEPKGDMAAAPRTLVDAVVLPISHMLRQRGALLMLLFVVLFKLPEVLVKTMPVLLMKDLGFSNKEVGFVQQGLGVALTIVGALAGGALVARLGLRRSLWVFGILGATSNAGYMALAWVGKSYPLMIAAVVTENFCAGLVTAGFVAFLMSQCDRRYSATQYALLTSLMALTGALSGAPTGWVVKQWGYPTFFALTILVGLPGMLLLLWLPRSESKPNQDRLCQACGYDLRGSLGPACPECGTLLPAVTCVQGGSPS